MPSTLTSPAMTEHANERKQYIVCTNDTCNGQPRIDGTRIRVWDVYWWYEREGRSVDQIVTDFPQLSPAEVHAALSYYWDHRDALHRHQDEMTRLMEEHQVRHPSIMHRKQEKR